MLPTACLLGVYRKISTHPNLQSIHTGVTGVLANQGSTDRDPNRARLTTGFIFPAEACSTSGVVI